MTNKPCTLSFCSVISTCGYVWGCVPACVCDGLFVCVYARATCQNWLIVHARIISLDGYNIEIECTRTRRNIIYTASQTTRRVGYDEGVGWCRSAAEVG